MIYFRQRSQNTYSDGEVNDFPQKAQSFCSTLKGATFFVALRVKILAATVALLLAGTEEDELGIFVVLRFEILAAMVTIGWPLLLAGTETNGVDEVELRCVELGALVVVSFARLKYNVIKLRRSTDALQIGQFGLLFIFKNDLLSWRA